MGQLASWADMPNPPVDLDPAVRNHLIQVNKRLTQLIQDTFEDITKGQSTFTPFSSAPGVNDIDELQIVIRVDAGNEALYTKIDGVIFSAALV